VQTLFRLLKETAGHRSDLKMFQNSELFFQNFQSNFICRRSK
jgi:hypothetical protein